MKCLYCGSFFSKVVDKRAFTGTGEIRRRRECLKCKKRFTTYESIAKLVLVVIKKDGRHELYEKNKLRGGIEKALEKRPGIDRVSTIVDRIESRIRSKGIQEIPTQVLGKWVLAELKRVDAVAYLRFASVYRTFQSPQDFEKELKTLN